MQCGERFSVRGPETPPSGLLCHAELRRRSRGTHDGLVKTNTLGKLREAPSNSLLRGCGMDRKLCYKREPALSSNKTLTSSLLHTHCAVKASKCVYRGSEHLPAVARLPTHCVPQRLYRYTNSHLSIHPLRLRGTRL